MEFLFSFKFLEGVGLRPLVLEIDLLALLTKLSSSDETLLICICSASSERSFVWSVFVDGTGELLTSVQASQQLD